MPVLDRQSHVCIRSSTPAYIRGPTTNQMMELFKLHKTSSESSPLTSYQHQKAVFNQATAIQDFSRQN